MTASPTGSQGAAVDSDGVEMVRRLQAAAARFRSTLVELDGRLTGNDDPDVVAATLLEVAAHHLRARGAAHFALVGGGGLEVTGRLTGEDGGRCATTVTGDGLAPTVARMGLGMVWPGQVGPSRLELAAVCGSAEAEVEAHSATALALPLRVEGHPVGALGFYGRLIDSPFTGEDVDEVAILVRRAEVAIDSARHRREAERLSLTDGLTGLWNRRHLDFQLESESARAVRFVEPFSLLFCDIDDFKSINDRHGHPAGDDVLVELGRRLAAATREVDVITRYGGDEFALLLPRTGLSGAHRLAEKIREAVAVAPFTVGDASVPVTISVGVATFPDHAQSGKDLLARADAALYRAKAAGGDRVENVGWEP